MSRNEIEVNNYEGDEVKDVQGKVGLKVKQGNWLEATMNFVSASIQVFNLEPRRSTTHPQRIGLHVKGVDVSLMEESFSREVRSSNIEEGLGPYVSPDLATANYPNNKTAVN
ncbi:hypothetical protein K0M31_003005 [Melipona bicolor]|uniref:Uncharacterized protein n=1 Tax=Melipona bicolor TaxID=60889 RepID=A0AA40KQ58_9HYME|nr:hypothetical protein K0M31_003005 [Melipona bicolor]